MFGIDRKPVQAQLWQGKQSLFLMKKSVLHFDWDFCAAIYNLNWLARKTVTWFSRFHKFCKNKKHVIDDDLVCCCKKERFKSLVRSWMKLVGFINTHSHKSYDSPYLEFLHIELVGDGGPVRPGLGVGSAGSPHLGHDVLGIEVAPQTTREIRDLSGNVPLLLDRGNRHLENGWGCSRVDKEAKKYTLTLSRSFVGRSFGFGSVLLSDQRLNLQDEKEEKKKKSLSINMVRHSYHGSTFHSDKKKLVHGWRIFVMSRANYPISRPSTFFLELFALDRKIKEWKDSSQKVFCRHSQAKYTKLISLWVSEKRSARKK